VSYPAQPAVIEPRLPGDWSIADLQHHLGGIPIERIRLFPPPGYATEDDVVEIAAREDRLFELEEGILVEKPMGWYESMIAALLSAEIHFFLRSHDLGKVFGADGMVRILPGMVKIPDVSFIRWERWPQRPPPRRPVPPIVPDLVVEVLSETNTAAEIDAKVERYFEAGVRIVWVIDPATRTARAHTGPRESRDIPTDGDLDGGDVLPGFGVSLKRIFDEADRQGPRGGAAP
jgi:Uma2 family endonuclease